MDELAFCTLRWTYMNCMFIHNKADSINEMVRLGLMENRFGFPPNGQNSLTYIFTFVTHIQYYFLQKYLCFVSVHTDFLHHLHHKSSVTIQVFFHIVFVVDLFFVLCIAKCIEMKAKFFHTHWNNNNNNNKKAILFLVRSNFKASF